jgi:hypothetical protein
LVVPQLKAGTEQKTLNCIEAHFRTRGIEKQNNALEEVISTRRRSKRSQDTQQRSRS